MYANSLPSSWEGCSLLRRTRRAVETSGLFLATLAHRGAISPTLYVCTIYLTIRGPFPCCGRKCFGSASQFSGPRPCDISIFPARAILNRRMLSLIHWGFKSVFGRAMPHWNTHSSGGASITYCCCETSTQPLAAQLAGCPCWAHSHLCAYAACNLMHRSGRGRRDRTPAVRKPN